MHAQADSRLAKRIIADAQRFKSSAGAGSGLYAGPLGARSCQAAEAIDPVHAAAKENDLPALAALLAAGEDVNSRTKAGKQTPLHYAARRGVPLSSIRLASAPSGPAATCLG